MNFSKDVKLFSKDGVQSDIVFYIKELITKNKQLGIKALTALIKLPEKFELFNDIKLIKIGDYKFYELRIRSKNDICRFFFITDSPNLIVLLGFTKKTQKTDKKDLDNGVKNLIEYRKNKLCIDLNSLNI